MNEIDNAVVKVKKGQALCIIIEGYEDHASTYDYDDVLQVILQQAQTDLNKRRSEKQRLKYELQNAQEKMAYANQTQCGVDGNSLGLYPR